MRIHLIIKILMALLRQWRLYRVIRNFSPHVAFIFEGSPRYMALILRLAGVKKVFCVPNKGIYRLLCTNSTLGTDSELDITKHGIEDRLKAVRLHGIEAKPTSMTARSTKKIDHRSYELVKAKRVVREGYS